MCQNCQQVIEQLSINISLFFEKLEASANKKPLSDLDKKIICQSLLGYSRQQIANIAKLSEQNIRDRLSKYIYPRIAETLQVEQEQIAGNWVVILNLLLEPNKNYKLNPPPQLNNDNFQGSFGRQIFLHPPNQEIVQFQIEGTQFYQQGLYYQALKCFISAWKKELEIYKTGNSEVLIYINNCLIEYKQSLLQTKKIKTYTLAVVVPFHHNQGHVAAEILQGIAQIQLQINLPVFEKLSVDKEINLDDIKPDKFFNLNNTGSQISLKILIVNDPNNLYDPYNQTAENLANLAPQLNLIAIIGHYSSEMTQKALHFYSQNSLALVNSSSTSNELSHLSRGKSLSFFRITTQDSVSAAYLASYLLKNFSHQGLKKVAIIYNQNSSYSTSYKNSFKEYLSPHQKQFVLVKECGYISETYYQIQDYLETINQDNVDIIIIIPDGGIEPNSLNNSGLISRLNLNKSLIAGSATFYQENVLHWIHEQNQYNQINQEQCQIIACIPWHINSRRNGYHSDNSLSQQFCQIATQLWGEENLTWRSATAFDSVLIILRVLEKYQIQDSQSLLIHLNQYFKEQRKQVQGVTGIIEFNENGDRPHPPSEIVGVQWNAQKQKWQWDIVNNL
ncbi:ABC transporter substrate-binding protein [Nodularia sp. UHCC 0506]|uniref:ABC transporter substrate-binding protein n=1 Tax=Nodularia sp. UHCC 0506 TaxID=3110243 RepID=UPI002B1F204D|nr:ABC transporter substrate-binding protein [Nodularia sp. UHCC 0506]MEA5513607.1 ABC transporter substrate-binding protein [Nodularia sp. UHCC 0506]